MMERRCENCGQPALADDKVCWHCGWHLVEVTEPEDNLEVVSARQGWQQPAELSAIVLYGGLTVVVIVLTLLVMGWLGRRPLIAAGPATSGSANWQAITAADQSFVIGLPDDWSWLDGTSRPRSSVLASLLAADARYGMATFPLGEELVDLDMAFVAATPTLTDNEAFLIVAASQDLGRLAPTSLGRYLREAEFINSLVLEVEGDNEADAGRVAFVAEVITEGEAELLRCQQEVVLGPFMGWLVSACSPSLRYSDYEVAMTSILASFQLTGDN